MSVSLYAGTTIHFGLDIDKINCVLPTLINNSVKPMTLGDGWEEWGEPVSSSPNDGRTLHFFIEVPGEWLGIHTMRHLAKCVEFLAPMTLPSQVGVVVTVSDWCEWSREETSFNDVSLREFVSSL